MLEKELDKKPLVFRRHEGADGIPPLYLGTLAIVSALFVIFTLLFFGRAGMSEILHLDKTRLHFFLLGVAFLLIEVKSINEFAILFGSTWVVNSAVPYYGIYCKCNGSKKDRYSTKNNCHWLIWEPDFRICY
jgi:hypothetical protein